MADRLPQSDFAEKVVKISRVSKKTKGGNQIGFSALIVVGDKKGKVGVALGKAPDVISSIKKGVRKAKKRMIRVPVKGTSIPFSVTTKFGAAKILLKPAPKGSGIIAGGAVRAVVEAAGISDIVGKILGSNNKANNVYATFKALTEIRRLVRVKNIKLDDEPTKTIVTPKAPVANPAPVGKPVNKAKINKTKKGGKIQPVPAQK